MRNRLTTAETPPSNAPVCWQREAPTACLRVELASGKCHLFAYQHFVTASLKRTDDGAESLRIAFSNHEVEIEGRGLRELLLGLQDFAVKWLRAAPARYQSMATGADGIVTAVSISVSE